jgi:hypothetical protein
VYLSQSGTEEIRREISVHGALAAVRHVENCAFENVGRIEVASYSGRYYLLGNKICGYIGSGDITINHLHCNRVGLDLQK